MPGSVTCQVCRHRFAPSIRAASYRSLVDGGERGEVDRPRRVLHREPSPLPGGGLGGALRGALLHGHELAGPRSRTPGSYYTAFVPPDPRRAGLHRQRLRGPGVHHLDVPRPSWPLRSSPETPDVELRLMLDGTVDGLRSRTRTPSPVSPPSRSPTASPGTDMLYSSGTTGRPKGVKGASPDKPLGPGPASSRVAGGPLRRTSRRHPTSPPAPLYHAAPLRFSHRHPRSSAARSSSWSTSTPSRPWR